MTVRVAPDCEARIRRSLGRVVLQVQEASDPEAAALALEGARPDIDQLALRGTREVERIPSGPFVMVVDRDDGRKRMLGVPEVVTRHLEDAGVDGTVACIKHGGSLTSSLWGLAALGPAVICRLYPPPPEMWEDPPTGLPQEWVEEAAAWLTDGLAADHALWSEVGLVDFSLDRARVPSFLDLQRRHRRSALVVAARPRPDGADHPTDSPQSVGWLEGDERPLRAAAVCSGPFQTHLALGAGGPGSSSDIPIIFQAFTSLARRMTEGLSYGFVDVAPTFLRFTGASHPLEPFCDEAVFDGFPYQVLGPGHLDRLGGPPPGSRALADGRVELAAGQMSAWIAESASGRPARIGGSGAALRDPVRQLLRPCLELDGRLLRQERWDRVKRRRLDLDDLAVPQYRFDPPER